jgi:sphinganine-1-phosphate aldolase
MAPETETQEPIDLDTALHPYRDKFPTYDKLPPKGQPREKLLGILKELSAAEESRWRDGYASGSVYHGDPEHISFLNSVYGLHSQANQLHPDIWPSATKFEAEIVSMAAHMLGAGEIDTPFGSPEGICGSVTSGGSESILLAIKTYRDFAKEKRGISSPELVLPESAHPAFLKACQYFCIKPVLVPLTADYRADVNAAKAAITPNTIALVGSAPNFPYGTIDPIRELSELARAQGAGFHTDGCLGGFFLPWAKRLGYDVPDFDFKLPGVTSMSCDTHKYGYAAKGTSVVLYRGIELRHHQYFTTSDWPGGLYSSPTFSGSRPGGLSAACWAALVSTGEEGYLKAVKSILDAVSIMKEGVRSIPELMLLGDSFGVFAFGSNVINAYEVLDFMSHRKWALTGLLKPAGVHVSPTLRQAQPGVAQRFVKDLKDAVEDVKAHPGESNGMAPIYGMAATVPDRSVVHDLLRNYMDMYYQL